MIEHNFKIGLDLDGVLADFGTHFLETYNLPTHPAESWDDSRFRDNFHLCHNDREFWNTIPALVSPSTVGYLKPVIYVTARPIPVEWSMYWLWKNGFPAAPVVCVGDKGSKLEHLKGVVDVFVDDAIHNFEELNAGGVNCLLMSRSHNKDYDAKGKRIDSLWQTMKLSSAYMYDKVFYKLG